MIRVGHYQRHCVPFERKRRDIGFIVLRQEEPAVIPDSVKSHDRRRMVL